MPPLVPIPAPGVFRFALAESFPAAPIPMRVDARGKKKTICEKTGWIGRQEGVKIGHQSGEVARTFCMGPYILYGVHFTVGHTKCTYMCRARGPPGPIHFTMEHSTPQLHWPEKHPSDRPIFMIFAQTGFVLPLDALS